MVALVEHLLRIKQIVLILIALMMHSMAVFSQENPTTYYDEILVMGRTWQCMYKYRGGPSLRDKMVTYSVVGERMLDDKQCKVIRVSSDPNSSQGTEILALEQDGIIYGVVDFINEDGNLDWMLEELFRFNYMKNELNYLGQPADVDSVLVNGKLHRRMVFPGYCIVEGIGVSSSDCSPLASSFYTELQAVFDNGHCIFTKDDFYKETATGIESPASVCQSQEPEVFFDLTGRQLSSPMRKGLYIRNGRKYVGR